MHRLSSNFARMFLGLNSTKFVKIGPLHGIMGNSLQFLAIIIKIKISPLKPYLVWRALRGPSFLFVQLSVVTTVPLGTYISNIVCSSYKTFFCILTFGRQERSSDFHTASKVVKMRLDSVMTNEKGFTETVPLNTKVQ